MQSLSVNESRQILTIVIAEAAVQSLTVYSNQTDVIFGTRESSPFIVSSTLRKQTAQIPAEEYQGKNLRL